MISVHQVAADKAAAELRSASNDLAVKFADCERAQHALSVAVERYEQAVAALLNANEIVREDYRVRLGPDR
jgi:hypothetical protein